MTQENVAVRSTIHCSIEPESWFLASREVWDELVGESDSDPLFNGWAWRCNWWKQFDDGCTGQLRAQLQVLVLRDADARLLAALPLYSHVAPLKWGLKAKRLQLLGGFVRGAGDNELSEYGDGCVRRGFELRAAEHFAATLMNIEWDDLCVQCVSGESWITRELVPQLQARRVQLRLMDTMQSWGVDLSAGVDAWRSSLSSNVRRRTIAQRNRLVDARLEPIARSSFRTFVDELNTLHLVRWDKPVYSTQRIEFWEGLLDDLPANSLVASTLNDGDTRISLLLNLRLDGREYNLQSAFNADATQKLSAGYLHLGFAIELATRDGMRYFDMLGGNGKYRAYKADLGSPETLLTSLQLLRSPKIKLLYNAWDAVAAYREKRAVISA